MTKAEAEAILAERPYDIVALAEASDEPFAMVGRDTVYFDPIRIQRIHGRISCKDKC